MKLILVFLGIFMMSISSVCNAHEKAKGPVYTDAAQFPLYGNTSERYGRMPQVDSPRTGNPIVMYGTSIFQGGCANRPGMAHTNILGRWLDREIINLGFSGNAYLDVEIAEYIATVENPSLIVLDYAPNCTAEMIDEKAEKFFRIVRDAHPDVPVIIVESPMYAHAMFDTKIHDIIVRKNEAQERLYKKLKKALK